MCGKFAESKEWQKKRKEKVGSNFGGRVVGLSRRSNGNSKISTFLEAAIDKRDVIVLKKLSPAFQCGHFSQYSKGPRFGKDLFLKHASKSNAMSTKDKSPQN